MMNVFGDLRSVLSLPPGEATFSLLEGINPVGNFKPEELQYIQSYLERWPEAIRRKVPDRWLEELERGREVNGLLLCTCIWWEGESRHGLRMSRLARAAHVEHIQELVLDTRGQRGQLEERLFHADNLTGLRVLRIRGFSFAKISDDLVRGCSWLDGLEELHLEGMFVGNVGEALFGCLSQVSRLRLIRCGALRGDIVGLVRRNSQRYGAEHWKALEFERCSFTSEHVLEMTGEEGFPCLEELNLSDNDLGDSGVIRVIEQGNFNSIRRLSLAGVGIEGEATKQFARLPALYGLEALRLDRNALYDQGVLALTCVPWLLRSLSLERVGMSDQGMYALSDCSYMQCVEELKLGWNAFGDDGIEALSCSERLDQLKCLSLYGSRMTGNGLSALMSASFIESLERLELDETGHLESFGEQAIQLLWSKDCAWQGDELSLRYMFLSEDFLANVLSHLTARKIKRLVCYECSLDVSAMYNLASIRVEHLRLQEVVLSRNDLGVRGVIALLNWLSGQGIQRLSLDYTGFHCSGEDLEEVYDVDLGAVEHLDLSGNVLGREGVSWLACVLRLGSVKVLKVADCRLCDEHLQVLVDYGVLSGLVGLELGGDNDVSDEMASVLATCCEGVILPERGPMMDIFPMEQIRGLYVPEPGDPGVWEV